MRKTSKKDAARASTTRDLLADVTEGLKVFRMRDGIQITDAQIAERARNIVAGLIGNYSIRSLAPLLISAIGEVSISNGENRKEAVAA